ncbi:MAG: GNAT family N-acetyltransferase [Lachnospiraceae bacterium]|nr:GNAT family N-acetyltransferase [Lachnospiraceae bacterium]
MMDDIRIAEIHNSSEKSFYTREILERLPEWFGNKQALDEYVEKVKELPYYAALNIAGQCIGFFAVKIHYQHTGDIFVCGVVPEYQHNGIGKKLYHVAENNFIREGCKYVIVKTLSDIVDFEPYAQTREFYKSIGFEPLITLTEMWDEENPCLIMFKSLV